VNILFSARLYRLVIMLIPLIAAIVLFVRLINGTQQNRLGEIFANPDGSMCETPCMFGIKPEITTFADAKSLLRSHQLVHNWVIYDDEDRLFQICNHGLAVYIISNEPYQSGVHINYYIAEEENDSPCNKPQRSILENIILAEFILALGVPETVLMHDGSDSKITIFYNDMQAQLTFFGGQSKKIGFDYILTNVSVGEFKVEGPTWLGFVPKDKYRFALYPIN
jgi:hypothetical protein